MNRLPVVLGINRTQDASICLLKDGQIDLAIQKERLTRTKHAWGKQNDISNVYKNLSALKCQIDVVVECYSSDPELSQIDRYHDELRTELALSPNVPILTVSHHLAHLYSAFPVSPFRDSAVLICDFMGSPANCVIERWPTQSLCPANWVEVASCYSVSGDTITCISKQMWSRDRQNPTGLGCFYYFLTQMLFPGEGNEGKVMGLAPYGTLDERLSVLTVAAGCVEIPTDWQLLFKTPHSIFADTGDGFQKAADLAATGQNAFQTALVNLCRWLKTESGQANLCYAGGTALNCVANSAVLQTSGFDEIYIPPAPHDGGTAVGCAIYGLHQMTGTHPHVAWDTDFLGPSQEDYPLDDMLTRAGCAVSYPSNLADKCADALATGSIVALFQGKSELGPRALGNRSILADPRRDETREYINRFIKGRELFRPLAPVVLQEEADSFFDLSRPSPFMQFAAGVHPHRQALIPAVTHVDGTARVQTLARCQNPFLYAVLEAFRSRTGLGVLLNTSLNGKGEPIVESQQDSVALYLNSRIDVLVMPPLMARRTRQPFSGGG